jgi:NosR/NirI family nitrous oxide reductase transcriptional regulator
VAGREGQAVVLGLLLTTLTLIFIFQAQLSRHRLAHRVVRNGFLLATLFWLGWTARVQLSTVNVINYVTAPFKHLDVTFYLAEPLMLILATYTLFSVLLIGAACSAAGCVPSARCRNCSGRFRARWACRNGVRRWRWRGACGWENTSRRWRCCFW